MIRAVPVVVVGALSCTGKLSWFSTTLSSNVTTVACWVVSPAAKVRVTSVFAVKSPSPALADPVSRVEYLTVTVSPTCTSGLTVTVNWAVPPSVTGVESPMEME